MKIEFTGRQLDVPLPLRRLAEKKLAKLARLLPGITWAHVTLSSNRRRETAEVAVNSPGLELVAREASAAFSASLLLAFEKIERQARRQLGRRIDRKRRRAARPGEPLEARASGTRVIRARRSALKPMTVDEAVREVDGREEGFLVFRDADTESVSVLYRRKDGQLGLIEPEA